MLSCWEMCMQLTKDYQLPFNHNAFIPKTHLAIAYQLFGEIEQAETLLLELVEHGERLKDFGTTMIPVDIPCLPFEQHKG